MPAEKLLYVIGIDKYAHPFHRKLQNAALDAKRFAGILQDRYGYRLLGDPLLDEQATMRNIRKGLAELARYASKEDTVIVYYGGHGIQHPDSRTGYWVPHDADEESYSYLDHSTVLNDLRKIKAKHVLLISDSCYSGTFISQTRGSAMVPTTDELEAMCSRWIYVSGDEEKVPDGEPGKGSPFTRSLCDFLQENKKPALPAWEVFDAATRLTKKMSQQDPQCEPMRHGHEGGQVVFRLTLTEVPLEHSSATVKRFPLPVNPALEFYMPRSLSAARLDTDLMEFIFDLGTGRSYLDELMNTRRRLVVLGTAGTGKSIELQHRAAQWNLTGSGRTAIFARFNTYTDQDITSLLPEGWADVAPNDLYIFLDGLDEIQPANFYTAVRKLNEFQSKHPLIGIVISCRTNFYELPGNGFSGTLPEFEVYYLNDVTYAEIIHHAEERYQLDGKAFLDDVHDNGFSDLVQKPFFLKVLLEHFKRTGGLAIRRSDMMEAALLDGYTGNREHFHSTGQLFSKPHTFALLEKLAFVMEVMGKNYLTDGDLAAIFPSAADYENCKYLPAFSRDDAKAQWSFDHNNIQEYLASRVLAKQRPDELITLISSEIGGERKIKPNWVNTLSFLISTGERELVKLLLTWLAANDREIVIRFEPDRVSDDQREILFRAIYDHYRDQGIWLHSNKFSDKDLARFGASRSSLSYLIEQLNDPNSDRNNRLNALSVLRHYPLANYPDHREAVKMAILAQLNIPEWSAQDIYAVMTALYRLRLNDSELISHLIERYGKRKNQYIRTGLYNIIQYSQVPDAFLQVYLDGLELGGLEGGIEDREEVNLLDESMALTRGIAGLSTHEALTTLFDLLSSGKFQRFFYERDFVEILERLMDSSIKVYHSENRLYQSILGLFQAEASHYQQHVNVPFLRFFKETGNSYRALWDTWLDTDLGDYEKGRAVRSLIDESNLVYLVEQLAEEKDEESLRKLHLLLFFNGPENNQEWYLQTIENLAAQRLGIKLERPAQRDWSSIHHDRNQSSFDLLFNPAGLQAEVNRIFDELGKEELPWDELFSYRPTFEEHAETRFNGAALLLLRTLMHGTWPLSRSTVNSMFTMEESMLDFRFGHIHAKLSNHPDIQASSEQIAAIRSWCIDHSQEYRKVWFFLKKFDFLLPESQLLDLTRHPNYSHETNVRAPGYLEELEPYLSKDLLQTQVVKNLKEPLSDFFAWMINAGYALRHELREAYPLIAAYFLNGEQDYSLNDILVFWFERTLGMEMLRQLAKKLPPSHLRWSVIRLLEEQPGEGDFLKLRLNEIIRDKNQGVDQQIYAARHLMKLNDLNALAFMAERIINYPDVAFDYRINLGTVGSLTDAGALPILTNLLLFANQPEHKKSVFNDLESAVLKGLLSIGAYSSENFLKVKDALSTLMKEHEQDMPQLRYVNFTIANIEQQLRKKEAGQISIRTAMEEYRRFSA